MACSFGAIHILILARLLLPRPRPPHHQKTPFPFLFLPSPASRRKRRCTHRRVESATARARVDFLSSVLTDPGRLHCLAPSPSIPSSRPSTHSPSDCAALARFRFPVTVASIKSPESTSGVESDDQDPGLRLGGLFSGFTLGKCLSGVPFLWASCGVWQESATSDQRQPRRPLVGPAMHLQSTCRRVGACPTTSDHGILDRSVR